MEDKCRFEIGASVSFRKSYKSAHFRCYKDNQIIDFGLNLKKTGSRLLAQQRF